MPIPQEKLDRLTELLLDQMLAEFEKAKTEGKAVDPRRIVAAQRLLESSNPKVFKPAEPEVIAPSGVKRPAGLADSFKTKALRDKLRTLPMLTDDDRTILNSFAEQDGADPLPLTGDDDERGT